MESTEFPAIYAVMMRPDPENNPEEYQIIYLCESNELSEEKSYFSHQNTNVGLKKRVLEVIFL